MKRLSLRLIPVAALALVAAAPASAQCTGDVIANGTVDVNDLAAIILNVGCTGTCTGDANGNGVVGENDYLAALGNLGPCPTVEDVNGDGSVNIGDMIAVGNADGRNCLADADNSGDVGYFDAYIISASVAGNDDALPLASADVDGDSDLDSNDTLATFSAQGIDCRGDVDRDGTVEGSPGEDDFELVCAAAGHC